MIVDAHPLPQKGERCRVDLQNAKCEYVNHSRVKPRQRLCADKSVARLTTLLRLSEERDNVEDLLILVLHLRRSRVPRTYRTLMEAIDFGS